MQPRVLAQGGRVMLPRHFSLHARQGQLTLTHTAGTPSPPVRPPDPVSYTHLTLPTNREV
eukprot:875491-Heterocapsa_arctica.AAC.1